MTRAAWIAVDWGTSNLRAWAMDSADAVTAEASSPDGMGALTRNGFEPALLDLIGGWLAPGAVTDVLACGMVGARQGWIEAAYAAVPCPPRRDQPFTRPTVRDPRLTVHVLHGLKQTAPADVMRGEETQIAGLIASEPRFDGVACLPGTHTKWVHVSAGEIVSFASFMTGEIFALLATQSVLRHSIAADGWSDPDFAAAVEAGLARPERIAGAFFGLRAAHLIADLPPVAARSRLSGLLIGAELAAARPYWLGRDVVLVGADRLVAAYRDALAFGGLTARTRDATEMTLVGLTAAHAQLLAERSTA